MSEIDLRLGRWQDVLQDVTCDALICDPPYSERTHSGHDEGSASANAAGSGESERRALGYACWDADDVAAFVAHWAPRTHGWIVALTDHVLVPAWEAAFASANRYAFAPLQFMQPGSRVRIVGDGPALWSVTIMVARPMTRAMQRWGSLPGGYVLPTGANDRSTTVNTVVGRKPLWLIQRLVSDYSRPGDLICDPCAGGATTLLAAAIEGRRAVGSEMDPVTHAKAVKRLARGYTPVMFQTEREPIDPKSQESLFGDELPEVEVG